LVSLILAQSPVAPTQELTTGTIIGVVKDEDGAVVPDASITAANKGTGSERTVASNENGDFSIPRTARPTLSSTT
jgi:hypothetical protein